MMNPGYKRPMGMEGRSVMIGGVDGYKWNITDSYDNNLNQRNNVNNKDELGKKVRLINLRPRSARPVKTANMLMALTKRTFPLKMLCIFHRKRHLLLSGHMRGSMFPMRITKLPRKTAKWYLHPSESRHRSARNVAVLIFPVV